MNKKLFIQIGVILLIFGVGVFLRLETSNLEGIPTDEKEYYQDLNGLPYMSELDSYYNYRLTKNYLEHGHLGDATINGFIWDSHSYYPPGVPLDYPPLIVYLTAFLYKFVNLFTDMSLIEFCFWLPAFIAPLAGIAAYLFVGRFTNQYGAISAGIITVTIPFYFFRTVPGWFDTDMFNLIFSFLVVWFLFEAYVNINKSNQKGILFSFLSGFSIFLFSLAWNGWQYLFYVIIIFWVIQIIWNIFKGRMVKNHLYSFLVFLVTTLALVGIFTGFINIIKILYMPLQIIILSGGQWADWPNVYISVAELGRPSLEDIFNQMGLSLFTGMIGLVLIFKILSNDKIHQKFLDKMNWLSFSFLIFWTFTSFVTLTQGYRFIMILIPPLVVSTGIMIGICVESLFSLENSKRIQFLRPGFIKVFPILILVIVLVTGVMNIENVGPLIPGTNDDVWAASVWINNNTPNNTVIMGEWGNGHLYTAIADRPVNEDGRMGYIETLPVRSYDNLFPYKEKSPSSSRDYWLCKAFSTDDENLSLGILRMLSTSGDEGYIKMNLYVKNTSKTVEILNNILVLNRSVSRELLINNYNFDVNQADEVLIYTHPENPSPMVLVTTDKMIGTGHWMFKFGEWNFDEKHSEDYIYSLGDVNKAEDSLNSTNDVFLDLKTGNITWKNKTPYCQVLVNNGTVKKRYVNPNSDFCIFIIDNKRAVVIDRVFENSIFTRLVIEKDNSTVFKRLYANNNVVVWGTKN